MFKVVYVLFYLLSLLPWFIIYGISDFIYFLLYYVFRYRRSVVMSNLAIAFPEKSNKERENIAKASYKGLVDTFIEVIKMLSMSKEKLNKMMTITGLEHLQPYFNDQRNIQLLGGHFYSWEMALHILADKFPIKTLGVYMPVSNKIFNELMYRIRTKFGAVMISSKNFTSEYFHHTSEANALLLAADQKPGNVTRCNWLYFFNKAVPFINGPANGAHKFNTVVVYADYYRVKRGKYVLNLKLVTDNPKAFAKEELTVKLRDLIEESVRKNPASYLWTHKRWKHEWKPEYQKIWIDPLPSPTDSN